ncbi:MAG TPA: hypothetical protein VED01_07725 [Burkholderiales bacterium]|nr:hypothetical protein [Burkholderiales bacterium]
MKTTIDFLDAVRARHGIRSDYQLAKFLGTTQPLVSAYRTGRARMGEDMCLKVAAALDLPAGYVLAVNAAERAKRTEVRKAWQGVARKLAGAALGFIAAWLLAPELAGDGSLAIAFFGAVNMDYAKQATSDCIKFLLINKRAVRESAVSIIAPSWKPHQNGRIQPRLKRALATCLPAFGMR